MIGLVRVGDVNVGAGCPEIGGVPLLQPLKDSLKARFKEEVEITSELLLPDFAYNENRSQYYSSSILKVISDSIKEPRYKKILGVVDKDLYVPGLNFVFGEAEGIPGRVGIISLTRLRQEFYGLPPDTTLFFARALKEAVHELGHLYGLHHCNDPSCVMHFSNSLLDTDNKSSHFCAKCKKKL